MIGALYRGLYRSVLSRFDPEHIHHLTLGQLAFWSRSGPSRSAINALFGPRSTPDLAITAFGREYAHPIGLAAGFDKDGLALPGWSALGFSFVEVGTVTPMAQPGNDRPRLFRLMADHALINRLGFPGIGAEAVARNLRRATDSGAPLPRLLISLGKNKQTPLPDAKRDYLLALNSLHASAEGFVINVSSPNTPELRRLQTREYLDNLLGAVKSRLGDLVGNAPPKPLLIKIAPDLSFGEIDTILDLALAHGVAGIVATNTSLSRDGLTDANRDQAGGLSGEPLRQRSTEIVQHVYRAAGDRLTVIGVGGVFDADHVWEKMRAGATLVQTYTGLVYEGPTFVRRCLNGLRRKIREAGIAHLSEIIGADARR